MSAVDANLVLEQFDFPTSNSSDWPDVYAYVVDMLRQGQDDASLEAADRHLHPSGGNATDVGDGPWATGGFRLFVSHTSAEKERAANLAEILARWGVEAFVAHQTIEPTREWQDEIERALLTCDALCAILTPDFKDSLWCDQEIGFVAAQRKLIIPLKVQGTDPHGFIGKYQAITVPTPSYAWLVADDVLKAMVRSPLTAEAIAPAIVRRYAKSGSFDMTRAGWAMLKHVPRTAWTPEMLEQVERAPSENSQVEHANESGTLASIPELAADLVRDIRGEPSLAPTGDDDIPF